MRLFSACEPKIESKHLPTGTTFEQESFCSCIHSRTLALSLNVSVNLVEVELSLCSNKAQVTAAMCVSKQVKPPGSTVACLVHETTARKGSGALDHVHEMFLYA